MKGENKQTKHPSFLIAQKLTEWDINPSLGFLLMVDFSELVDMNNKKMGSPRRGEDMA